MLIKLRNKAGKLVVKDLLDIDFDMFIEKEGDRFFINVNSQFRLDDDFETEESAEESMIRIANSRNKIEEDLLQY